MQVSQRYRVRRKVTIRNTYVGDYEYDDYDQYDDYHENDDQHEVNAVVPVEVNNANAVLDDDKYYAPIEIKGTVIEFEVDSGCRKSIISANV